MSGRQRGLLFGGQGRGGDRGGGDRGGEQQLEGEVLNTLWRAEDGGFAIVQLQLEDRSKVTVVGPLGHALEGQHLKLQGRWVDHPTFGQQFKASRFLVEHPRTLTGLERYLASGSVQGLGPTFARRVVAHFGLETLRIIEDEPQRLAEVPGIGPKRVARIVAHWARDQAHREVVAMLRGYGIGQALSARIVERYGKDSLSVVTRTPYRLAAEMRGVGFRTADLIARDQGIPLDDPGRAEAALVHLLADAEGEGHCFVPRAELLGRCHHLEVARGPATEALARLAAEARVVVETTSEPDHDPVYHPALAKAEARLARGLLALSTAAPVKAAPDLAPIESALAIELHQDQRDAVQTALREGVTVVTGGPGTGKTTIVRTLLAAARARKETWLLAAPTGRAARRLAETTGAEARTVHRLLEFQPRTSTFAKGPMAPLEAHGVLVDEASMLDLRLAAQLVGAVPPGTRLVLVGDADQLPSVGAGRVLADIIDSGQVPVATLREVYRQAADSGIVRNAHRINRGEGPISGQHEELPAGQERPDFYIVSRERPQDAQDTVVQILTRRLPELGFDPRQDVQVLCPMHQGILGTEALNRRLQAALNPGGPEAREGQPRAGDRVLQTRNDYDRDIFNGDVGHVMSAGAGGLQVDFEGRQVPVVGEASRDLQLAYAMSIHKSQGSEYPAVVVVLHRAHHVMLRRNLLYTAITRARRFCCIVGDPGAILRAVETPGGQDRWSRLAEQLCRLAGAPDKSGTP